MAMANPKAAANLTARDTATGLVLAALILGAALTLHIGAIFFVDWSAPYMWLVAIPVVLLQTWLFVGMFIVAHDSMHGSLVPRHPAINTWIGRVMVGLYAGFSFNALNESHHRHHRYSGTPDDPDFDANHPRTFWPWYATFFRRYFGWKELAVLTAVVVVYAVILRGRFPIVLLFWALPALASSVQLFYFGTYLPHRIGEQPFRDRHNARSLDFDWLLSLVTCFHFGYHHEHHDKPWVPWWKLPDYRETTKPGDGKPDYGRS